MQLGAADISDAIDNAYNLGDTELKKIHDGFEKRISQAEKTNRMQTMALIAIVIFLYIKHKDAKS
tara:strand:- start:258 stop:452 length:195 start_codon:yes stop_codon:yes gene_type:complete